MTANDLLPRLELVRRSGRGWIARCPAHHDHTPSLSISEGDKAILLRRWADCSLEDIAGALGLRPCELFYDSEVPRDQRQAMRPRPELFDWRHHADQLEDEAWGL